VKFEEKYKKEASCLSQLKPTKSSGKAGWKSPSNIALIKYWGKRDHHLPQNPSLSFTLDKSYTETRLQYESVGKKSQGFDVDFKFEDLDVYWTTTPPPVPGVEKMAIGAHFEGTNGSLTCDYDKCIIRIGNEVLNDIVEVGNALTVIFVVAACE